MLNRNDFLDIEKKTYFNFKEAKKYLKKLNLKSNLEFKSLYEKNKISQKLPKTLEQKYKRDKNWKGLADFLSLDRRSGKFVNYTSFNEAKKIVFKLKLKSLNDWKNLSIKIKRSNNLPSIPERNYKKHWKGWGDFLGTGRISTIYFNPFLLYVSST